MFLCLFLARTCSAFLVRRYYLWLTSLWHEKREVEYFSETLEPLLLLQKLQLHPDEPLSVYVDTSIPRPSSEALEDIHNVCKGLDGFLHLKYSHSSDHVP